MEANAVSKTCFKSRNSASWMRDGLDFKSETSSGKCGLYDIIFEERSFERKQNFKRLRALESVWYL